MRNSGMVRGAVLVGFLAMAVVAIPGGDQVSGQGGILTKASMPTARCCLAAGVVNGVLYAVGGNGYLSTLEAYDPATNAWTAKASMHTERNDLAVGVANGILYAVGGYNGSFLSTLEAYDPATNTWTTKAPMPTPRWSLAVGVVNGVLYAVGGYSVFLPPATSGFQSTLEAYDPATNSWTAKAPMPTPRNDLAAGVVNGVLYAVGGYNGNALSTIEAYDPATSTWTTKTSMPTPRRSLAAGVANGVLYAVGGGFPVLSTVEAYDPATNIWTTAMTGAQSPLAR